MLDSPGATAWAIVFCDDPVKLGVLEKAYGLNRNETVDWLIEESCWTDAEQLREVVGGKGTAQQRLEALRHAWKCEQVED